MYKRLKSLTSDLESSFDPSLFKANINQELWNVSLVIPFHAASLSISADCDTCPVKHTSCENGVTSSIVLYKHNVPWFLLMILAYCKGDRLQFVSRSVTELMTSNLSNTAINACYLKNKMIQFVFFSRWVIG